MSKSSRSVKRSWRKENFIKFKEKTVCTYRFISVDEHYNEALFYIGEYTTLIFYPANKWNCEGYGKTCIEDTNPLRVEKGFSKKSKQRDNIDCTLADFNKRKNAYRNHKKKERLKAIAAEVKIPTKIKMVKHYLESKYSLSKACRLAKIDYKLAKLILEQEINNEQ